MTRMGNEQSEIETALRELADVERCAVVFTTGGTGPALRDVTPEALASVFSKLVPGFGEQIRRASVDLMPTAILSRQEAGIRGASLIMSLPGNPAAIVESLEAVFAAVSDAVEQVGGPRIALAGG
jgi:molybdopterin adenylyltransferase